MTQHPTDEAKKRAEALPNDIYLLIGEGEEGSTIWCDHIPDKQMEAVKYTRALTDAVVIDAPEGLDEAIVEGTKLFCNAKILANDYCADHRRICYTKVKK